MGRTFRDLNHDDSFIADENYDGEEFVKRSIKGSRKKPFKKLKPKDYYATGYPVYTDDWKDFYDDNPANQSH